MVDDGIPSIGENEVELDLKIEIIPSANARQSSTE